jgi:hypothetical protein
MKDRRSAILKAKKNVTIIPPKRKAGRPPLDASHSLKHREGITLTMVEKEALDELFLGMGFRSPSDMFRYFITLGLSQYTGIPFDKIPKGEQLARVWNSSRSAEEAKRILLQSKQTKLESVGK